MWAATAVPFLAWSCAVEFRFLRRELNRTPAQAWRDAIVLRVICWGALISYFLALPLRPLMLKKLGL